MHNQLTYTYDGNDFKEAFEKCKHISQTVGMPVILDMNKVQIAITHKSSLEIERFVYDDQQNDLKIKQKAHDEIEFKKFQARMDSIVAHLPNIVSTGDKDMAMLWMQSLYPTW